MTPVSMACCLDFFFSLPASSLLDGADAEPLPPEPSAPSEPADFRVLHNINQLIIYSGVVYSVLHSVDALDRYSTYFFIKEVKYKFKLMFFY